MSMDQLSRPTTNSSGNLTEQLDDAIGEASTGIGVMLSELVRRSLKGGVANIGDTLQGFAEARVLTAVEEQMPQVAETASSVAESTSSRMIQEQVTPTVERLSGAVETFESKLQSESAKMNQQLTETSAQTEKRLAETAAEADRRLNETSEHLGSLKENAKAKWKKLVAELEAITHSNANLTKQISNLNTQLLQAEEQAAEHRQQVGQLQDALQQMQSDSTSLVQQLQEQNLQLDNRLKELERPRGLKAMWQKVRKGKPRTESPEDQD